MSTLRIVDPCADVILDFIAKYESAGNYNAVIGNAQSTDDLSALTISDIYLLQSRLLAAGRPSTAVGRYQIIRKTLQSLVAAGKAANSDKFTPPVQDALGLALLVFRGYQLWRKGIIGDAEFAHRLSMEWAALPDPDNGGKSHYDGVGPNHAGTTLASVYAMLASARAAAEPPSPPAPPQIVADAIAALTRLQSAPQPITEELEMSLRLIIEAIRDFLGKPAPAPIDVGVLLDKLAREHPTLNVRTSVVDLMRALGMDPLMEDRIELAAELGVTGEVGTAATNVAMHRALLLRVAANGGRVPDELL